YCCCVTNLGGHSLIAVSSQKDARSFVYGQIRIPNATPFVGTHTEVFGRRALGSSTARGFSNLFASFVALPASLVCFTNSLSRYRGNLVPFLSFAYLLPRL